MRALLESGASFIKMVYFAYGSGAALYTLVYLAALIFFAAGRNKKLMAAFSFPAIAWALTVFNPIVIAIIVPLLNFHKRFYRFFWMVPFFTVTAFVFTKAVCQARLKWLQTLLFVSLSLLMIVFGASSIERMRKPENIYKIRNETIHMADAIAADAKDVPAVVLMPESYFLEMRLYRVEIGSPLGRPEYLNFAPEEKDVNRIVEEGNAKKILALFLRNIQMKPKIFKKAVKKRKVTHIILENWHTGGEYLENLGAECIYSTENAKLFRLSKN